MSETDLEKLDAAFADFRARLLKPKEEGNARQSIAIYNSERALGAEADRLWFAWHGMDKAKLGGKS